MLSLCLAAVMSANERTETVFECIRGGAEDYLLKPVTRKEVQHMWQHVWRRQQQNALRVPHMCPEEVCPFSPPEMQHIVTLEVTIVGFASDIVAAAAALQHRGAMSACLAG